MFHLNVGNWVKHNLLRKRRPDTGEHQEGRLDAVVRADGLLAMLALVLHGLPAGEDVQLDVAEVAVVPGNEAVEALRLDIFEATEEDGTAETVLGERQGPAGKDAPHTDLTQLGVAEGPHVRRPA